MRKSRKLLVMCSLNVVIAAAAAVMVLTPSNASAFDDIIDSCNQQQCDGTFACNTRAGMNCAPAIFASECLTKLC